MESRRRIVKLFKHSNGFFRLLAGLGLMLGGLLTACAGGSDGGGGTVQNLHMEGIIQNSNSIDQTLSLKEVHESGSDVPFQPDPLLVYVMQDASIQKKDPNGNKESIHFEDLVPGDKAEVAGQFDEANLFHASEVITSSGSIP